MKRKAAEVATATKVAPRGATTRATAAAAATVVTARTIATTTGSTDDATAYVDSATGTGIFDRMDVLSCILSFVGPNQYRFVAPISQKFRAAYAHTFNNETKTSINTYSIAHAKICLNELKSDNLIDGNQEDAFPWRNNTSMLSRIGQSAAYCNNLALLQFLKSEGFTWDAVICSSAAKGGHFDLVKWLHANDCLWDELACAEVAARGDLEMLEWMIDQGCEPDARIHMTAATRGHLHVLKWAYLNVGFPEMNDYDRYIYEAAQENGHVHITEWWDNGFQRCM